MSDISPESEPIVQLADMPVAPQPPRGFDYSRLILPGAILVSAFMISAAVLYSHTSAPQQNATIGQNQVVPGNPVNIDLSSAPMLGNASAPVTVVEFGDFQCPYCQRYFQANQPQFINQYVNTGKIKFVWKDYAFLGQESFWAAEAARCANDQGQFWAYHDYLYSHQGSENSGAFSKANLKRFAAALGLNTTQFNSCLDSDKYLSFIQQETQQNSGYGVSGTPATFINGKIVADANGNSLGAAPFSVFQALIEKELKK